MLYGTTLTQKLPAGAGHRPAPARWTRVLLSIGVAVFAYGAIDEATTAGRVGLVALSVVGAVAVASEVLRRRARGERWSLRALSMLLALSVVFVAGGVQAALFRLQ
jgi:hypothetical protein